MESAILSLVAPPLQKGKKKKKKGTKRISRTKMEKKKQIRKFQTKWDG